MLWKNYGLVMVNTADFLSKCNQQSKYLVYKYLFVCGLCACVWLVCMCMVVCMSVWGRGVVCTVRSVGGFGKRSKKHYSDADDVICCTRKPLCKIKITLHYTELFGQNSVTPQSFITPLNTNFFVVPVIRSVKAND